MPAPTEPVEKRKISDDDWEFTSVVLEKSSTRQGFGIAISGGKDNPHFKTGDTSILVTDIIKGSPADGTLRIGDKLISVNEKLVDGGSHKDAVHALKAAGMQARMEIKRPMPKKPAPKETESNLIPYPAPDNSTPKGSVKSEERGRSRKKPKEMEQESGDRDKRRSRSRNREENGENGEKSPRRSKSRDGGAEGEDKDRRRHRSKSRDRGEDGEEKRRHRSKSRDRGEDGEEKPRKHRSHGEDGEKRHRRSKSKDRHTAEAEAAEAAPAEPPAPEPVVEAPAPVIEAPAPVVEAAPEPAVVVEADAKSVKSEDGEKRGRSRSRSRHKEEGDKDKKERKRSRSRAKDDEGEEKESRGRSPAKDDAPRATRSRSRGRSKSRSRDDLTRSKSKESLHRSKSKSRDQLSGVPPGSELTTIVLERGPQGYGFSLGQQIFIRDMATDSPADKADNLEKGDVVHEINGTRVDNLKVSECIEIIRAATEQLTLTLIKKPKEVVEVVKPATETKERKKKPKPADAPAKALPKAPEPEVEAETEVAVESAPVEAAREVTPPPERPPPVDLNETSDSWTRASPEKPVKPQPTQEMENMDAKLERLKAGRRFETRMSQLPNARVISFHKTGSVGIQVAGGNFLGIFVAAIRDDSPAAKEGLKPGDQILMCNEIDFEDITREEAVLILLALPDDVSLVVESKLETFEQIKKELGDKFFIRVNFDHLDKTNSNELMFRKGEIFNVRDTMYQGLIGYWQAQRVGKNAQLLERGVLPNKSRAEQLAIAQKMEDRQALMPTRSKVKRRPSFSSTLKKHKFVSQDKLDESSFAESVQIPAYERVVLKIADFMRPVVILGALGDLVRLKLLEEMPDRFDVPTPMDYGTGADTSYGNAIKISEIRNVIVKNKHCLLDITPDGIEMLMYAQLCPIVILLKSTSRGAVKEMRSSLVQELKNSPTAISGFDGDPLAAKQVKKVFSNAKKLEEFYPHIFTAKINTHIAGADVLSREFYYKLKEIIFAQQAQSAWMPEEKPQEVLDDVVFHPPNYTSYLSGADSDTEGESMTSSPVMAKKHYDDDDESPLQSPVDEPEYVRPAEPRRHHRREKSRDRETRSSGRKSKSDRHQRESSPEEAPAPESPPTRPLPPQLAAEPSIGELEELITQEAVDETEKQPYVNGYADDDSADDAPPSPRSYRDPPSVSREIESVVQDYINDNLDESSGFVYGSGRPEQDSEEDIPVLRDPNYSLPRPVPDSPPSRRPPEVQAQRQNYVKVMPSELSNEMSLEEKRRSLKHVPDHDEDPLLAFAESGHVNGLEKMARPPSPREEDEPDLPPYRPPPPPDRGDVPEKVLTLKERMSKFQNKSASPPPAAAKPAPVDDETPPPARPAAPRNYINDMRSRGGPKKDLYAQNIITPSPEFPEITRIQKPVQEPAYINVSASNVEYSPPEAKPPGYANVKHNFSVRFHEPATGSPCDSDSVTIRHDSRGYDCKRCHSRLRSNNCDACHARSRSRAVLMTHENAAVPVTRRNISGLSDSASETASDSDLNSVSGSSSDFGTISSSGSDTRTVSDSDSGSGSGSDTCSDSSSESASKSGSATGFSSDSASDSAAVSVLGIDSNNNNDDFCDLCHNRPRSNICDVCLDACLSDFAMSDKVSADYVEQYRSSSIVDQHPQPSEYDHSPSIRRTSASVVDQHPQPSEYDHSPSIRRTSASVVDQHPQTSGYDHSPSIRRTSASFVEQHPQTSGYDHSPSIRRTSASVVDQHPQTSGYDHSPSIRRTSASFVKQYSTCSDDNANGANDELHSNYDRDTGVGKNSTVCEMCLRYPHLTNCDVCDELQSLGSRHRQSLLNRGNVQTQPQYKKSSNDSTRLRVTSNAEQYPSNYFDDRRVRNKSQPKAKANGNYDSIAPRKTTANYCSQNCPSTNIPDRMLEPARVRKLSTGHETAKPKSKPHTDDSTKMRRASSNSFPGDNDLDKAQKPSVDNGRVRKQSQRDDLVDNGKEGTGYCKKCQNCFLSNDTGMNLDSTKVRRPSIASGAANPKPKPLTDDSTRVQKKSANYEQYPPSSSLINDGTPRKAQKLSADHGEIKTLPQLNDVEGDSGDPVTSRKTSDAYCHKCFNCFPSNITKRSDDLARVRKLSTGHETAKPKSKPHTDDSTKMRRASTNSIPGDNDLDKARKPSVDNGRVGKKSQRDCYAVRRTSANDEGQYPYPSLPKDDNSNKILKPPTDQAGKTSDGYCTKCFNCFSSNPSGTNLDSDKGRRPSTGSEMAKSKTKLVKNDDSMRIRKTSANYVDQYPPSLLPSKNDFSSESRTPSGDQGNARRQLQTKTVGSYDPATSRKTSDAHCNKCFNCFPSNITKRSDDLARVRKLSTGHETAKPKSKPHTDDSTKMRRASTNSIPGDNDLDKARKPSVDNGRVSEQSQPKIDMKEGTARAWRPSEGYCDKCFTRFPSNTRTEIYEQTKTVVANRSDPVKTQKPSSDNKNIKAKSKDDSARWGKTSASYFEQYPASSIEPIDKQTRKPLFNNDDSIIVKRASANDEGQYPYPSLPKDDNSNKILKPPTDQAGKTSDGYCAKCLNCFSTNASGTNPDKSETFKPSPKLLSNDESTRPRKTSSNCEKQYPSSLLVPKDDSPSNTGKPSADHGKIKRQTQVKVSNDSVATQKTSDAFNCFPSNVTKKEKENVKIKKSSIGQKNPKTISSNKEDSLKLGKTSTNYFEQDLSNSSLPIVNRPDEARKPSGDILDIKLDSVKVQRLSIGPDASMPYPKILSHDDSTKVRRSSKTVPRDDQVDKIRKASADHGKTKRQVQPQATMVSDSIGARKTSEGYHQNPKNCSSSHVTGLNQDYAGVRRPSGKIEVEKSKSKTLSKDDSTRVRETSANCVEQYVPKDDRSNRTRKPSADHAKVKSPLQQNVMFNADLVISQKTNTACCKNCQNSPSSISRHVDPVNIEKVIPKPIPSNNGTKVRTCISLPRVNSPRKSRKSSVDHTSGPKQSQPKGNQVRRSSSVKYVKPEQNSPVPMGRSPDSADPKLNQVRRSSSVKYVKPEQNSPSVPKGRSPDSADPKGNQVRRSSSVKYVKPEQNSPVPMGRSPDSADPMLNQVRRSSSVKYVKPEQNSPSVPKGRSPDSADPKGNQVRRSSSVKYVKPEQNSPVPMGRSPDSADPKGNQVRRSSSVKYVKPEQNSPSVPKGRSPDSADPKGNQVRRSSSVKYVKPEQNSPVPMGRSPDSADPKGNQVRRSSSVKYVKPEQNSPSIPKGRSPDSADKVKMQPKPNDSTRVCRTSVNYVEQYPSTPSVPKEGCPDQTRKSSMDHERVRKKPQSNALEDSESIKARRGCIGQHDQCHNCSSPNISHINLDSVRKPSTGNETAKPRPNTSVNDDSTKLRRSSITIPRNSSPDKTARRPSSDQVKKQPQPTKAQRTSANYVEEYPDSRHTPKERSSDKNLNLSVDHERVRRQSQSSVMKDSQSVEARRTSISQCGQCHNCSSSNNKDAKSVNINYVEQILSPSTDNYADSTRKASSSRAVGSVCVSIGNHGCGNCSKRLGLDDMNNNDSIETMNQGRTPATVSDFNSSFQAPGVNVLNSIEGINYDSYVSGDEMYTVYTLPLKKPLKSVRRTSDTVSRPAINGDDDPIVIATARGLFDHRGGLLESVETNVSIFIPYGALPEGKKQEIYFKVCQDSNHMPPLDSSSGETLLSPLVMCGPHGLKFRKPIELRLPHKGASNDSMAFSLKSSDSPVGHPGDWRNVRLGNNDLDGGRAYQVTDDTVSVLVDHF